MKARKSQNNPSLLGAFAHPLRIQLLKVYAAAVESPATAADKVGYPLSNVSYHTRELFSKYELLVEAGSRQVRGATQHYYRAKTRSELDLSGLVALPDSLRAIAQGVLLGTFVDHAVAALEAGDPATEGATFDAGLVQLDTKGWQEASVLLAEAAEKLARIETESKRRLKRSQDASDIRAIYGGTLFKVAPLGGKK